MGLPDKKRCGWTIPADDPATPKFAQFRDLGYACVGCLLWLLFASISLAGEAVFPLQPDPEGRYLQDGRGRPFLITGDSAWSLIADLPLHEAEFYLDVRKDQGFNTILVSLIEHKFARNAPANFHGEQPFLEAAFERPNDAYFEHAASVIKAAADRNMLVLLCPTYLGAGGGPEGWYSDMVAAGPRKLKAYGRYVGQRYAAFKNILWVQGGDFDPPDRALVDAVADGVAEGARNPLQTVHGNRDTVTSDFWGETKWLAVDTVYTYDDVVATVLARYQSGPPRPFFFIEGKYEGEHGVDEDEVRLTAYGVLLSGAAGQVFGNNPVWHFSAPGLFAASEGWKPSLFSRGAASIKALSQLFAGLAWWKLVPDQGLLLKADFEGDGRGFAARDVDGSFAVIYVADVDHINLDLDSLAGGPKRLRWYDPSDGTFPTEATLLEGHGTERVALPERHNSAGFRDWVGVVSNDR